MKKCERAKRIYLKFALSQRRDLFAIWKKPLGDDVHFDDSLRLSASQDLRARANERLKTGPETRE